MGERGVEDAAVFGDDLVVCVGGWYFLIITSGPGHLVHSG
jgi:hypothetical protein